MTTISTGAGARTALGQLSENLPFMARNLHTLMRVESDRILGELGLEAGSIGILFVVAGNPGISQNDVAVATVLNKTAVATIVKRLDARGLLSRQRSAEDARVKFLFLTDRGRETMDRAATMLDALHARAFADVAPEHREIFFRVSTAVIGSLGQWTLTEDTAPFGR